MVDWAESFFPPPLPPVPSVAAATHALQSTSPPLGAKAKTMKRPAVSSAETRRKALSLTFLPTVVAMDLAAFPSRPKSLRTTILVPSAEEAAVISSSAILPALAAACSFFHAITDLVSLVSVSLNLALRTVEMDKFLSSLPRALMVVSSSSPLRADASVSLASKSSAFLVAAAASALVTPTMRRTPLAMPSSLRRTKLSASLVLLRWVPPQNSTLYLFHIPS
mmetsp:Transcript_27158/g.59419  ORF Transcript_27158/g.59419 Transcript_27158/m.59419 type:complete len:222 (+) Transcript_27158:176-841(+)